MFVPPRNRGAFDPREPFSRAEAQAAGLTAEMLLSKRFHKIFWDHHPGRRPVDVRYGGASARTIAVSEGEPPSARACRSRLQSRPSWTSLELASGLSLV